MIERFFAAIGHSLIRAFAFTSKEIRDIAHQPRLIFSLILGPFFILVIFGLGYRELPRTLNTLFVVPEGSRIEAAVRDFATSLGEQIEFAGITRSAEEADSRLRQREVDLVVVTPPDPQLAWENNEQAPFVLYHYEIDPLEETYIRVLGQRYADVINQQVLFTFVRDSQADAAQWQADVAAAKQRAATLKQALAVGDESQAQLSAAALEEDISLLSQVVGGSVAVLGILGQTGEQAGPADDILARLSAMQQNASQLAAEPTPTSASLDESQAQVAEVEAALDELDEMLTQFMAVEAHVMVAPFRSETLSITNVNLQPMHFYVPAVISLLLQHLAITLAGLTVIREKMGGAMELFRASPVRPFELVIGKYISYFIIIGVLAAVLTLLVVMGLRVPQLGQWNQYVLVVMAVLLASLGIGFNISLSARSDSQAIQLAMLTLLASIFFSGFFLPLYRLAPPVRLLSWMLPATYGTVLLQNVMLRGQSPQILPMLALIVFGTLLLLVAWLRMSRQMKHE
jgi:ABC-2 type transport system permease protein